MARPSYRKKNLKPYIQGRGWENRYGRVPTPPEICKNSQNAKLSSKSMQVSLSSSCTEALQKWFAALKGVRSRGLEMVHFEALEGAIFRSAEKSYFSGLGLTLGPWRSINLSKCETFAPGPGRAGSAGPGRAWPCRAERSGPGARILGSDH